MANDQDTDASRQPESESAQRDPEKESLTEQVQQLRIQLSHARNSRLSLMAAAKIACFHLRDDFRVESAFHTGSMLDQGWLGKRIIDLLPSAGDYFVRIRALREALPQYAEHSADQPWARVFPPAAGCGSIFEDWIQVPPDTWNINGNAVSSREDVPYFEFYIISPDELVGPEHDFRIEYKARAGRQPQDLSVVTGGKVDQSISRISGFRPEESGYCFVFGGFGNQATELQRCVQTVRGSTQTLIEPGREHHCVAERIGGVLRFAVDGREVYSVVDDLPLIGKNRGHVGLYTCGPAHSFWDLQVYVRPTCLPPDILREIEILRDLVIEIPGTPARFFEIYCAGANTFYFKDVTDAVEQREELEAERTQREKMEAFLSLASAAAHEMNQPLTVILGNVQLILENVPQNLSATMRDSLRDLRESTDRLADIVRKIGAIRRYRTKPYVEGTRIVDIDASSRMTTIHIRDHPEMENPR